MKSEKVDSRLEEDGQDAHPTLGMFIKMWLILAVATGFISPALAAVDLVTVPSRDATQLTIYNSEDITMVREQRLLTVKQGEKELAAMENLGLSPLPNGQVRLFSEYQNRDLAYVGGTSVKYVPIGDRVEVNVGLDHDITGVRRLKDQRITDVVCRQYKRRLDHTFVLHYDLVDYDETFIYEEEFVSGKAVPVKTEIERRFADNIVLWGNGPQPNGWNDNKPGAYVDLHDYKGKIEKVDTNHVKYFLDLASGEKKTVTYSVTYKKRKVGPEINTKKVREPI